MQQLMNVPTEIEIPNYYNILRLTSIKADSQVMLTIEKRKNEKNPSKTTPFSYKYIQCC